MVSDIMDHDTTLPRYWVRSEMDTDGRTASTNISRTVFNSANTTQGKCQLLKQ